MKKRSCSNNFHQALNKKLLINKNLIQINQFKKRIERCFNIIGKIILIKVQKETNNNYQMICQNYLLRI